VSQPADPAHGVVAAGHPATLEAAATVLRAGGNAYDAVIAAGFAASVAEPCLSSLGGGGFLLASTAAGRRTLFDFFVDTPGRARDTTGHLPHLEPVTLRFGGAEQVFHVGHASVAVPGCLAGYLHVHRRLGRAPLSVVVEPALQLARTGVVIGPDQGSVVRLLRPIFARGTDAARMFVPDDVEFSDTAAVTNPALADFLGAVADGTVTGFDDPDVIGPIVQDMDAAGGLLTAEDLRAYAVVEREPLRVDGRGWAVVTNPEPSYGGRLITRALRMLADEGPAGPAGSGPRLEQFARVLDAVTRLHRDGDHDGPGDVEGSGDHGDGEDVDRPRTARGTTHVSVVDRDGNLAAMTTSNGSGSGLSLGTTGVLANNIMGESDLHPAGFHRGPAGQRVGSMMAPSVLLRDGAPDVALGSGGSERIRSALTQTLAHLIDDRVDLRTAVLAPRIHVVDDVVQVEPGFAAEAVGELATARAVNVWSVTDLYFGGVHAVATDGDHAADPRRGGRSARVS
jgi:gamma-glutamyltranspeptidase / glutathione hydrolase